MTTVDVDADDLLALLEAEDNEDVPKVAGDAEEEDDDGEEIMDFDALEDDNDDDDEEEEDEDEDDDDEAPRKKSRAERKGRKAKRSKFLDEDAGDSEESADDEGSMAAGSDENPELADTSYIEKYERKKGFLEDEEGDVDEIAARLEARYKQQREDDKRKKELADQLRSMGAGAAALMDGASGTMQFSADFLPKASDPKVFAVKCRPHTARQIVTRLTNKCYHYRNGDNHEGKRIDLGIISCFALDHVKEWVYVESHRQLFVENAVNGLENVFRYKIVRIEHHELMQLMVNQGKPKETLSTGELVRLRTYPYRSDLGQVVELLDNGRRALVKVVPRVDFVQKKYVKPKKTDITRPQRFFVADLALGTQFINNRFHWGDYRFTPDGYLELNVPVRSLIFGSKLVKPSIEEIATFMKDDQTMIADAAKYSTLEEDVEFNIGDPVKVSKGELAGTIGRVIDLSPKEGMCTVECRAPGAKPLEIRVELLDCSKYFADGSRIEVIGGPTQGDTGTVLTMSGEVVIYLCDSSMQEASARANNCHVCNIRPKERHTMGSWSLYDLVQLTDNTAGLITKLTPSTINILTTANATKSVSTAQVKQTLRPRVECLDAFNNTVRRSDAVSVMPTTKVASIIAKTGKVLQVYGEAVFIRVDLPGRPSIIAALPGKDVSVLGGVNKIGMMKQKRREVHIPERAEYIAQAPKQLSARYDAPSQPWHNTQVWNGDAAS